MERPTCTIYDVETGETTIRELTDEEIALLPAADLSLLGAENGD